MYFQPEEVFASFDAEPLGTASLAQVHRAVLHSGEVTTVIIGKHFWLRQELKKLQCPWICVANLSRAVNLGSDLQASLSALSQLSLSFLEDIKAYLELNRIVGA